MIKKYYVDWSVEGIVSNWGKVLGRYYTSSQVDALLGDYRAGHADAGGHRGRAAGLQDGPGPGHLHNQPNHLGAGGVPFSRRPGHGDGLEHRRRAAQLLHHRASRRPPCRQAWSHGGSLGAADSSALSGRRRGRRGGGRHRRADPGPHGRLAVKLDGPPSGCSVVLATHTAGVSVDGYTLTLAANPWNIVRTYNLTPATASNFGALPATRRQERWTSTASRSWTQPWRPATRRRRRTRRLRHCC